MKVKSTIAAVLCVVVSVCLSTALVPAAYAAPGAAGPLTATAVATTAKKSAPQPEVVNSVKAVWNNGMTLIKWPEGSKNPSKYVTVSWDVPKEVKGLKRLTYTVRYSTDPNTLPTVKTKTTSKTSIKLPAYKAIYVQFRTNAKSGKAAVHSKWATYQFSYAGGGGAVLSNGVVSRYKMQFIDVSNCDEGKPGSKEAAWQDCIPRSLALSDAKLTSSEAGTVEVSWKEPKAAAKWDKAPRILWNNKYDLRYSYSKSMKKAKVAKNISGASKTLTGLKKGKRVYVQVRARTKIWSGLAKKWYDDDAYYRWSAAESIKMPSEFVAEEEQGDGESA